MRNLLIALSMSNAEVIVSLLFLAVVIAVIGCVVALFRLCVIRDNEVNEYDRLRRQEFNNRD